MTVQIINGERPPNYEKILAAFPRASGKFVIFSYGDRVYNPAGNELSAALIAHETVHCIRQQRMGVDEWWDKYITDPEFRYNEELLAHQAEYLKLCDTAVNRQQRRAHLAAVAKRLAGGLYGHVRALERVKKDLQCLA